MFEFLKNIINKKKPTHSKINFSNEKEIDEIFTRKFVANRGIFNYNGNEKEALENLRSITHVEQLTKILCFENEINQYLTTLNLHSTTIINESDALFMSCEGLIAFDGSIMISADQIKNYKLSELPKKIIIWAHTNQFYTTSSEGMQQMRILKKGKIPSNITCIRGSLNETFMQKDMVKKIFLILVEDAY